MRHFNQDSSSTLESQPPPPSVLFPASVPLLNTPAGFAPDLCHSVPGYLASLDVRPPRLSSSTSSTGMAAAPRSHHPLPNIGYNTRGIYSTGTPGYPKRSQDHIHRSPPPYSAVSARRHPLSPTPSPGIAFNSIRMDPPYGAKGHTHIPPLQNITHHGQLMYANGHGPIKIDIHGTIDKGFFLSEGEWTCYRRNYFSCVCSYSLSPMYPNAAMQWTPSTSPTTTYDVFGFSMSIAAVVSESDSHTIELVQHTPKRDKGPTQQPEKVQMAPKPQHQSNHPLANIYQDGHHHHRLVGGGSGGALYEAFSQPQGTHPTEHTFERIQFKQATANNGKRRAAQQYYHLVIELYGHVCEAGRGAPDQWLKIAHRKSAKMIVRGRSPGHYQSERRGSTSSGPGNSGGALSSYQPTVSDYGPGTSMLGSNSYGTGTYDHHQHHRAHYGSNRQHELPMEPVMAVDDVKAMESSKEYQYYPTPIYESSTDPRQGIEMFTHRSDAEAIGSTGADSMELSASRLKHEDSTLPSLFYPPNNSYVSRGGCNRYDGKSTSAGYYPTMLPQSS